MYDAQDKPVEVAIDAAIADFIAAIEALANHAPIRSAIYASAISKLIDRVSLCSCRRTHSGRGIP